MNTYKVTYWPPTGNSTAVPVSMSIDGIPAYSFSCEGDHLVFIDTENHPLLAVPVALNPVVTQTAAA